MTSFASVLGVLGCCWVGIGKTTHIRPLKFVALRACVLGVLGLRTRARMRGFLSSVVKHGKNPYASPVKPNTLNTLNTGSSKSLNLLVLECVGFVLAVPNMCWVLIREGR